MADSFVLIRRECPHGRPRPLNIQAQKSAAEGVRLDKSGQI